MIYTVTFNPALDYVVWMDALRPGQINRTNSEEIQYGGKGINVSTVLSALGVENVALGFLAGFTGRALEEGLRNRGIRTDFIWLPDGLTRINVKVKGGDETEINGRGPTVDPVALRALRDKLDRLEAGDILVISGSVPSALSHDVYEQILARLEDRGIQFVVDTTRDLLESALPYHPFLIKPNNLELGEIFGNTPVTDTEIRHCAAQLQAKGARNVLVSMAGDGSLLVDERGNCHRLGVPKGKVRNSVGAGDSMVAGFLAGWLETGDYAYAQRLGAAAGSATAFADGLATKEQIMALIHTF
ncbi:1-phosphofructokinase [Flavonifractor plautii]|uniref:1-phosphofructokinase n=1 Tax=Flavonifractor plautii TaxID=292800 RepID=UPI00195EAC4A|nr:1-phosphofructokinase [Flavonifractor plautii]MBM6663300.1 1-phosphofructokinase [Flavonifractor plautii]